MEFVEINPKYQARLGKLGLAAAADFLDLPAVVVCAHPQRSVARVTVGSGPYSFQGFLKREASVPWKVRLAGAWAGCGLVSRSGREARLLRDLHEAGIGCPEWVAHGQDARGRAFLLVSPLDEVKDLRAYLRGCYSLQRQRLAVHLGRELARMHAAGFTHGDLYAKHVLVHGNGDALSFLDWQRGARHRRVSWPDRCRDLAALQATLADDLATRRDRLACLRAYLKATEEAARSHTRPACRPADEKAPTRPAWGYDLRAAACDVLHQARRLTGRRRIRDQHQPPLSAGKQNLVHLEGGALRVAEGLFAQFGGKVPPWLTLARLPGGPKQDLTRTLIAVPRARQAVLVRRHATRFLAWLGALVRGKPLASPEWQQADVLFRLQRLGIPAPRLLAYGQRQGPPWRQESLLLVEPAAGTVNLLTWLTDPARELSAADRALFRRRVVRDAARLLRRLHDAGCYGAAARDGCLIAVQERLGKLPRVLLDRVETLASGKRPRPADSEREFDLLRIHLMAAGCNEAELGRFERVYQRQPGVDNRPGSPFGKAARPRRRKGGGP